MRDHLGFPKYIRHCLPEWFPLAPNGAQLDAMRKISQTVFGGGMRSIALEPREGKTTLAMAAALWATFEGRRRFPLLLCSTSVAAVKARNAIDQIKALETHGRYQPFYGDQVRSIWDEFTLLSRQAPGFSRPGQPLGSVVQIERPDLLIIDDPDSLDGKPLDPADLENILCKTIPAMNGIGQLPPPAILLGSPELVARIGTRGGWQTD
jgi:hypothetical protein